MTRSASITQNSTKLGFEFCGRPLTDGSLRDQTMRHLLQRMPIGWKTIACIWPLNWNRGGKAGWNGQTSCGWATILRSTAGGDSMRRTSNSGNFVSISLWRSGRPCRPMPTNGTSRLSEISPSMWLLTARTFGERVNIFCWTLRGAPRSWPVFRQTFSPPRVSFGEIPCITGKPCVKRNTPGGKPECSTVHRSLTSSASTTLSESFGTTRSPTGRRLPWWENTAKDQGKNCFKP